MIGSRKTYAIEAKSVATAWTLPVTPDKAPESHLLSLTLNSSHDNEALSVAEDEIKGKDLSA